MKFLQATAAVALLVSATAAKAEFIDFLTIANGNESGASSFVYGNPATGSLTVTAQENGNDIYAYLDNGDAGMGACTTIDSAAQCDPSSDDNLSDGETLTFTFSHAAYIDSIFLNNNHDGDRTFSDTSYVLFNGVNTQVENLNVQMDYNRLAVSGFFVSAGQSFTLSHGAGAQSYVSAIKYNVSEPGTIALFSFGLIALGFARRRTAKQA